MLPEWVPGDKFIFLWWRTREVFGDKFKPFFREKRQKICHRKSTTFITPIISKFHHLEILGPLPCNICWQWKCGKTLANRICELKMLRSAICHLEPKPGVAHRRCAMQEACGRSGKFALFRVVPKARKATKKKDKSLKHKSKETQRGKENLEKKMKGVSIQASGFFPTCSWSARKDKICQKLLQCSTLLSDFPGKLIARCDFEITNCQQLQLQLKSLLMVRSGAVLIVL